MARPKDPTPKKQLSINVPLDLFERLDGLLPRGVTITQVVIEAFERKIEELKPKPRRKSSTAV